MPTFDWYLVFFIRNQIKHIENVCFYWYLICKMRCSKMVNNKDMQFFMENLKINRKRTKTFLTFRRGYWNSWFSVIFPAMIWIFMEDEGDEINSKQASKRDRTLPHIELHPTKWQHLLKNYLDKYVCSSALCSYLRCNFFLHLLRLKKFWQHHRLRKLGLLEDD